MSGESQALADLQIKSIGRACRIGWFNPEQPAAASRYVYVSAGLELDLPDGRAEALRRDLLAKYQRAAIALGKKSASGYR